MTKIEYIKSSLEDAKLRKALSDVVDNVDALIPQSESEFMELKKFGLYPAEQCVPFVTKQGTPFYQLDNMAMVPKGETSCYLHYGDFEFRQIEVLYNMARMDSEDAHNWLKDNLFQGSRVDARKKQEYNSHRQRFSKHKGLFRKLINEGCWSFPKAVMAEFARLVYLTAYLKTHFPDEFTRAALCVAASEDY
jgi:hypothetical protein